MSSRHQSIEACVLEVTDHAVVRYLERVVGYDINDARREIARLAYDSTPLKNRRGFRWNWERQIIMATELNAVTTVIGPRGSLKFVGEKLIDGQRIR